MEVVEDVSGLRCWFSDNTYTSLYFMPSVFYRTRALKFEARQVTAVRDLIFVEQSRLELFDALFYV